MNIRILLFLLLAIILTSCATSTQEEDRIFADVQGVVNSGNAAVAGADIHIRSHFNPGGFSQGEDLEEGVDVGFSVSSPGVFTLNLYQLGNSDPFATVFEDTLSLGDQLITVPDSLLSNGVYIYQIITPLNQAAQNNFLVNKPDSNLINTLPYTRTNATGEFEIDAEYLAIDTKFSRGENDNFTISDSLQIIVIKEGNIIAREFLQVSEDENFVEIEIQN